MPEGKIGGGGAPNVRNRCVSGESGKPLGVQSPIACALREISVLGSMESFRSFVIFLENYL
jgi:hypothetical protein